ncbi:hypothetical protein BU14_0348s0012 [Porphyra umbilicalis]|uniref:Cytochrome b5 heme-binding domain-containing protein n=1 Tax=Porphyra umbilicalis TaxID=2786 RepID=A0A1X6NY15_PORUM|nr:hypothetical protein BU14_0348s0012 [Porphyra umbilicalis]|eukprot:OSX73435.1 hypothetical protein BU14_0348s0012 [Porphyra umbilicalis]
MRAAPAGGRRKVALAPGHSHLDWMRLTASLPRYRGPTQHTLAEVAAHRRKGDAWTVIRGRVYDVSRYVDYHPGGAAMLLSGAGKDATALFDKYHPWVNIEAMMRGLCLGELVDDDEEEADDTAPS